MTRRLLSLALVLVVPFAVLMAQRGEPSQQVEWLYYGGDQGGMKYSSLADINATNVAASPDGVAVEALGDAARRVQARSPGFFEARR